MGASHNIEVFIRSPLPLRPLVEIHLFGASTPVGEALSLMLDNPPWICYCYTRGVSVRSGAFHVVDLSNPASFSPAGESGRDKIYISFAPIWKFAAFLHRISCVHPRRTSGLRGVIACSSSSIITKSFAVNHYDKDLVALLSSAEQQLLATCRSLDVSCCILQPTLIYGQVGNFGDRNLSRLLQQMRHLPLLPLPADSGLRQPIHASQLAAVALHLAQQFVVSEWDPSLPERIALGGDTTLTYTEMIQALQNAQSLGDPVRRCRLLSIPNRLYFLLAAPLLLRSPKAFEAVLRMGANLSGFTPAHQLLGSEAQPFPVLPLA
jgi:hypothetical protein